MTREVLVQKVIALGVVALALTTLPPFHMAVCFAVLGQGHFIASYYYRWKAGVSRWYVGALVCGATLFFVAAFSMATFQQVALFAAILFFIHHFQDEPLLWGKPRSLTRTLEQLPPVILYASLAVDSLFRTTLFVPAVFASVCIGITYLIYIRMTSHRPDALSTYLALAAIGIATTPLLFGFDVAPEHLFGSIILFHYASWYVYYYFKTLARGDAGDYLLTICAVHGVVFISYALYVLGTPGITRVLWYAFAPFPFYIWATLHILASVRPRDYSAVWR